MSPAARRDTLKVIDWHRKTGVIVSRGIRKRFPETERFLGHRILPHAVPAVLGWGLHTSEETWQKPLKAWNILNRRSATNQSKWFLNPSGDSVLSYGKITATQSAVIICIVPLLMSLSLDGLSVYLYSLPSNIL